MADHIRSTHHHRFKAGQLPVLLDISEGPVDETKSQSCPFCSAAFSMKRLMDHIAGHMEELSLFVLPNDSFNTNEAFNAESSGDVLSSLDSNDDLSVLGDPPPLLQKDESILKPGSGTTSHQEEDVRMPPQEEPLLYTVMQSTGSLPATPPTRSPSPYTENIARAFSCDQCNRVFDQVHKLQ